MYIESIFYSFIYLLLFIFTFLLLTAMYTFSYKGALSGISHTLRPATTAVIRAVKIGSGVCGAMSTWLALRQIHVSQHSGSRGASIY